VLVAATLVYYRTDSAAPRLGPTGVQPFADTPKDKTMKFSNAKRPLLLGLALAVTGAAGAAVAVTLAVANPSAPQTPPAVPVAQAVPAGAAPSIAPAAASSAPAGPAAPAAVTPTVISLDQARGIAERAGNGQADKVQADTGPTGISYDVSVTRSDGTDIEVVVDGHTGRILSTVADSQNPQDSNVPD
jgi:hypothetical protein